MHRMRKSRESSSSHTSIYSFIRRGAPVPLLPRVLRDNLSLLNSLLAQGLSFTPHTMRVRGLNPNSRWSGAWIVHFHSIWALKAFLLPMYTHPCVLLFLSFWWKHQGNLGFSILPEVSSICKLKEPGIEPLMVQLADELLQLLSHSRPIYPMAPFQIFWSLCHQAWDFFFFMWRAFRAHWFCFLGA